MSENDDNEGPDGAPYALRAHQTGPPPPRRTVIEVPLLAFYLKRRHFDHTRTGPAATP